MAPGNCTLCEKLCVSRSKVVNGRGPMDADVMIVGEGPGFEEDRFGKPFVGQSGKLLAQWCARAGIDPTKVRLTNVVRCRPPGNRTPTMAEIRNCQPYLLEEIRRVNPKVIVAVGGTAIAALIGVPLDQVKVGSMAGLSLEHPETGIPVIGTYHPSFVLRGKWGMVDYIISHLTKARRIADGEIQPVSLVEARKRAMVARTVEDVRKLVDFLVSDDVSVVVADTETTGLSWLDAELLCFSFSALDAEGEPVEAGWTIPLMHTSQEWWPTTKATKTKPGKPKKPKTWRDGHVRPYWTPEDEALVVAELHRLFDSGKPLAFQNAGFDIRILERSHDQDPDLAPDIRGAFGFTIANHVRIDTMLMQRLIDENLPYNETALITAYCDLPYYEAEIKAESLDKTRMDLASNETVWEYAALDSDGGARIIPIMTDLLAEQRLEHLHRDIHIPMLRACWQMTRRGIPVDLDYFDRLTARFKTLVVEAEADVMKAYGGEWFNLRAPKQVQHALFEVLKLPVSTRKTDGAKNCQACKNDDCDEHDSTGKDALIEIKQTMGDDAHPILDKILRWKFLDKRKGTYIDGKDGDGGLVPYIGRETGHVHPEFFVNRTDTGRLAAYDPPIQTWPKDVPDPELNEKKALRRTFALGDDEYWFEADWSQGEVWVMAYESGDEKLLELLLSGRDVHTYVARKFCEAGISEKFPAAAHLPDLDDYEWRKEWDHLRKDAKVFVFGIDYGMTAVGIAERLVCEISEATMLREFYLREIFSKLDAYFERIEGEIEERGYNEAWSGRRAHSPDKETVMANARYPQNDWEEVIRKQANMPIQAGLNDIHMYIQPAIEEDPAFDWYRMFLAVHDSVSGAAKGGTPEEMVKRAWQLKEFMEGMCRNLTRPDGTKLDWRIPVEIQWGRSWGSLDWTLGADGTLTEGKS